MKTVHPIISAIFVFIGVFFLAGWFVLPHVPPVPARPVSALELAYWTHNGIGLLLGLVAGGLAYWAARRFARDEDRT
jgi:hypothetical protein